VVVLVLLPALVILWGLPSRTADLWAWTIKPDLTPIFMGAGYGAGAYFFVRVHQARRWHEVSAGVVSAAVFALLMLVTTLVHYDKFNHGHAPVLAAIAFFGWTIVYVLSPLLVGWLWWREERRAAAVPEAGEALVPETVRRLARVGAIGALLVAAVVLVSPSVAIDNWGWSLTPLTARVLACFTAQVGVGFLLLSRDPRWSGWRTLVETFLIAVALLLLGGARVERLRPRQPADLGLSHRARGRRARAAGALPVDAAVAAQRPARPRDLAAPGAVRCFLNPRYRRRAVAPP